MANRRSSAREVCIGIDIGGTFTDAVLTDGSRVWRAKSPTTPDELSVGVLAACSLAAERAGKSLEQLIPAVKRFGLGTTAITNVLTSRTRSRHRPDHDEGVRGPDTPVKGPPAERRWLGAVSLPGGTPPSILGVEERIDLEWPANFDHSTSRQSSPPVGNWWIMSTSPRLPFRSCGPSRIRLTRSGHTAFFGEEFPEMPIMSGAALNPIIREFERTTFAVLNAYTVEGFKGIDALARRIAAPRSFGSPSLGPFWWWIDHR